MVDLQSSRDDRGIAIDKVGVGNLRYPISVLDRSSEKQHTVALISLSVDLPHDVKGTHMSRFIEVLNRHRGEITFHTIPSILSELRERLSAPSAHMSVAFPYFIERVAPVSGAAALLDFNCIFEASNSELASDFVLTVEVPVTTLCPCSKAISDYGAHNQRAFVNVSVRAGAEEGNPPLVWIEELVKYVDESSSCPIYPLLKREDERYVTMHAYDNPRFVEDVVREVASRLRDDQRIAWFKVEARTEESIHNHNAFGVIEWSRAAVRECILDKVGAGSRVAD